MNDISKHYGITLNTKGSSVLSSDQLLFNHGDDITIDITIVEDSANKNLSQAKVDLLLLHELDDVPVIHRFEDGGINISDNVVTISCKSSYINKIGVSVCQLIIRDEDQSITTQMFSYKTNSTLVSDEIINAADKIDTLVELDKTIENCKSKILETSDLLLQINNKTNQLVSKVENEILSANSILREVERAESERVITFDQIKKDNESLKGDVENIITNVRDGVTPNISVGNVTTLDPGAHATVVRRGNDENPIFDFGIPKGADGVGGGNANIDDTTISKTSTWSSEKIEDFVHTNDDVVWSTVQGENLSIDYTKEGKLREVEIWGNTWQDSGGKNLCPNDWYTVNDTQIECSSNIYLKENTDYFLKCSDTTYKFQLRYFNASGTQVGIAYPTGNIKFTTINDSFAYCKLKTYEGFNNLNIKVQIEEGTVATDYVDYRKADLSNIQHLGELYVDEEDRPILDSEGREQYKIEVESCNDNLNVTDFIYTIEGNQGYPQIKLDNTIFKPNTKYEITIKILENTLDAEVGDFTAGHVSVFMGRLTGMSFPKGFIGEKKAIQSTVSDVSNRLENYTFRIDCSQATTGYAKLKICIRERDDLSNIGYIPHISNKTTLLLPCQLMKVGDVADRLYWDSEKKKYVVEKNIDIKEINKTNLPTSIPFLEPNRSEGFTVFPMFKKDIGFDINEMNDNSVVICDKFKQVKNGYNLKTTGEWICSNANIYTILQINNNSLESLDRNGLLSWLGDECIKIYYKLNFPQLIETNITEQILLPCYKDKTHLFVTGGIDGGIKARVPLDGGQAIQSLSARNVALNDEVNTLSLKNGELKETNDIQDQLINTTMLATDEMYMMLEPLLSQVAQTLSLERSVNKMVDLYVAMVIRGLKTIDEVPTRYREQVEKMLAQLEK